ncbi:MAG: hypothetical protein GEU90_05165 [Gemmatimonas sp.]|nr:hypothetical protein [Gemmatimonas sp.]
MRALIAAIIALIAFGFSDVYGPAVADWYAQTVIEYAPEPTLRFRPGDDPQVFYVCAKSVIEQIEDNSSVVTFAATTEDQTVALGGGRYRVDSYVEEARVDGSTLLRSFSCIVRLDDGKWRLEELELNESPMAIAIRGRL